MHMLYSTASTTSMRNQYCAYTHNTKDVATAFKLIRRYQLDFEVHANRVRFWVTHNHLINVYCALRFRSIDHETNHVLGE